MYGISPLWLHKRDDYEQKVCKSWGLMLLSSFLVFKTQKQNDAKKVIQSQFDIMVEFQVANWPMGALHKISIH